jgi:hypothetical protein
MSKLVTLRLEDTVYQELKRYDEADNRSLSNFIETATLKHIQELEFASDEEMDEILSDSRLRERLKRGSREAKKKIGRRFESNKLTKFL